MKEIAEGLNQSDVRTRRGNGWTIYSISRLLRNPAYAGFRRWDGIMVRTSHQAIVEIPTFNDTQRSTGIPDQGQEEEQGEDPRRGRTASFASSDILRVITYLWSDFAIHRMDHGT